MHKVKIIVFSLLVLFFFSCSNSLTEHVIQVHENGKPKLVELYQINGKDSVKVKEIQYYPDGYKRVEGRYRKDKKDGAWTFWFENGTVWSSGFFTQNIRTGKTKVYHENGNPFYEGNYLEGNKDGIWIFYNQNGEEVNKITFENGKMVRQEPLNKENKE